MTTKLRTLADVETDLSLALRDKTGDMLDLGRLLNEAKALVEHGEWLPWLRRHTALSASSAQNYMKAAVWVDGKNATVGYLDLEYLSPGAIYALASGKYSPEVVEQVLDAAAAGQRHINEADVKEIAKAGAKAAILKGIAADQKAEAEEEAARLLSLAKAKGFETVEAWEAAREATQQAQQTEAERELAEVEAILDGGPDPDLPPASEPVAASSEAFHVATFEKAIGMLRSVETKPASMFGSAKISPNDIEQITIFAGGGQADRRKAESGMIDQCSPSPPDMVEARRAPGQSAWLRGQTGQRQRREVSP
jgi:hypothetical protein